MLETYGNDIGAVMAAAARILHVDMTSEAMLQAIVDVAARSVPGFDRASVAVVERNGRESTKAATDELARSLDALQYELDEGPCIEAMQKPGLVEVPHLRHQQRWPRYVQHAAEQGVTAQLSIMLYLDSDHTTLGGLNLYSTGVEDINEEARAMAELFATQAAVALGSNRHRLNLNQGLASRQLVGQAIGIVMERYRLDERSAFQYLVRTSSTTNTKLRLVAQALVDSTTQRN
jgi:GAF domain-containing protein